MVFVNIRNNAVNFPKVSHLDFVCDVRVFWSSTWLAVFQYVCGDIGLKKTVRANANETCVLPVVSSAFPPINGTDWVWTGNLMGTLCTLRVYIRAKIASIDWVTHLAGRFSKNFTYKICWISLHRSSQVPRQQPCPIKAGQRFQLGGIARCVALEI